MRIILGIIGVLLIIPAIMFYYKIQRSTLAEIMERDDTEKIAVSLGAAIGITFILLALEVNT